MNSNPIIWQPSKERIADANITRFMAQVQADTGHEFHDYADLYQWSIDQRAAFWDSLWRFAGVIAETKGEAVLLECRDMMAARWFPDARLNYAENLLRHRADNTPALIFWGEGVVKRTLLYRDLIAQVSKLAQALQDDGVVAGDRVAAVLPNVPESVIAMLAVTSIGAVWASCSPDFGTQAIIDRFGQINPKVLFIVDGYRFNGKEYDCRDRFKSLVNAFPSLHRTVLINSIDTAESLATEWIPFDVYTRAYVGTKPINFAALPFDHPLFILFSSGTTGVPKCIVHGAGGTLLQHLKEHLLHTDVHTNDRLFYFTTCGWMMWNWLVSGLASGATLVLYDGSPVYPSPDILFDMIDAVEIDIFGVSARFIDAVKKSGLQPKQTHKLTSLKTILSTGSPLVPESFDYIYQCVKADLCLSSISGGTDIVSCFVLGCPILPVRRGEIQCRGLGMQVEVIAADGRSAVGEKGELVCSAAFPSMPIGFWNDADKTRYRAAYFEKYPGIWCHGDFAELCPEGGVVIYGRSDTVLNPGGVRIGSAEIYRQVEQIDEVLESVVIGQQWDGDSRVILFVCLRDGLVLTEALIQKIKNQLRSNASPRHVPAKIIQVDEIPKTKSGKIVEKAVRDMVHGVPVKNVDALANPEALEQFVGIEALRSCSTRENGLSQ